MGIRLQKVFDVYASKKSLTVSALKFLFDGQRLIGDMTPDALGECVSSRKYSSFLSY